MGKIEIDIRKRLVQMMDPRRPVSEVDSHIQQIKSDLEVARPAVAEYTVNRRYCSICKKQVAPPVPGVPKRGVRAPVDAPDSVAKDAGAVVRKDMWPFPAAVQPTRHGCHNKTCREEGGRGVWTEVQQADGR